MNNTTGAAQTAAPQNAGTAADTQHKHLTCIICPMGCSLEVTLPPGVTDRTIKSADPALFKVTGNSCPRGDAYARKELTEPTRTLTCTVAVSGGVCPLVSAKTNGEIPKELQLDCMQEVRRLTVKAPVTLGDVLARDLLHTGVDLVAGGSVKTA